MSMFEDLSFFLVLLAALIPAVILGLREKPLRVYSLFLSLLFIALTLWDKPAQLAYLAAFYVLSAGSVKAYAALYRRMGRKGWLYAVFLTLTLAPLLIFKISGLFHGSIFAFLGVSYLTFKTVQVIIEIYDGIIKDVSLFDFSSFLLFFPTLSSGPIDRSRRFEADLRTVPSREDYAGLAAEGLRKLLLGAVYKFVLSALVYKLVLICSERYTVIHLIGYAYSYGVYMFFDFAGYSLMAIGAGYILGIRTPENFNHPFLSTDMKDFWNRWHISLSHWFRDFIFTRFMMRAIKGKWFRSRLTGAFVGFLVNMLIMGLWHGLDLSYILYGLYHGLILGFTEIYQKKSKFYKKNKTKTAYRLASWFVTLNLVMFGFLIFSGHFIEVVRLALQKFALL